MARACPLFKPLQTKEEVKAEFNALILSEDRGEIASQYPDIAALLWVLDSSAEAVPTEKEILAVEASPEEPAPPHRWWGWGRRKREGGA